MFLTSPSVLVTEINQWEDVAAKPGNAPGPHVLPLADWVSACWGLILPRNRLLPDINPGLVSGSISPAAQANA